MQLNISHNAGVSGDILSSLSYCSNLLLPDVSTTTMGGSLDGNWSVLSELVILQASQCQLSGSIPDSLSSLPELSLLGCVVMR